MKYGRTAHNGTVYAAPPVGGSASTTYPLIPPFMAKQAARRQANRYAVCAPFPRLTPDTVCRPWKCYAFPYAGRQTVLNSRNVRRNFLAGIFLKTQNRMIFYTLEFF